MIKKRKIMTALVLTVVMVAGNAMSAFAATRTASGRGYALGVQAFAKATVTTSTEESVMNGTGGKEETIPPTGQDVFRNVKIKFVLYRYRNNIGKVSDTIDAKSPSKSWSEEKESYTYEWASGSMVSCNVITYVGLSSDTCTTTGAVAQIVY